MSKRVIATTGILAIAAIGGVLAYDRMSGDEICTGTSVAGGAIGGPFELVDENGQTVTEAEVITEPTLLYFGYTFCPDVCPIDNARNAVATDILAEAGHDITPVFISVDPKRDTVDVVRDYTENFHPKMIGLTGSAEQVAAAADAYRVVYRAHDDDPDYYLVDHSVFTYLTLPDQGFVDFFRREDTPEQIAARVSCILDAQS